MAAAFVGKQYRLDASTNVNFNEYMKALGVSMMSRKFGHSLAPIMELTLAGDEYTLKSMSTVKNTIFSFKLGREFDQETTDGRKVKATVTADGNKLIEVQKGAKPTTIVREFSPTEIKCTMTIGDIVATRTYKSL